MSKIISISVWGNKSSYLVGTLKNIELAQKIFPDWICRIFIDETVPSKYVEEMMKFPNAEVAQVDEKFVFGAFWRFYSMFQNEDDIVISRDSDSRLSKREKRCVDEWLESDKKFSIIRDHERHYDWPILAGMWGIKGKMDDDVFDKMKMYYNNHFYTSDQIFLKEVVWPIAKNDCLMHGFKEVEWMKKTRDKNNFIGQGYDENENPIYSGDASGEKING